MLPLLRKNEMSKRHPWGVSILFKSEPLRVLAVAIETTDLYFEKLRLQETAHTVEILQLLQAVKTCQIVQK